ncbi:hypothetical protein ONE63_011033 [Megalurothrips usitatus]|uniref:Ubiquitin carboxyl-terminal hydrolase n=1 Tax=Megalurothrips usitatus TaxID=439358 RepID=A0AAV7XLP8_9NEOP|nr:hypothetical protein ONE63_011033 [Megalurothrips usitatus]
MPSFKVKVKWGKEMFPDVEVNTDEDPLLFKAQLFALTGVQPNRQKVMVKGMTLKDTEWGTLPLKDGVMVLLMGSKEEDVPSEPAVKPVFMEDMNESELASAMDLPAGLTNLGNTCYLNATVQCLKTVPELRDGLQNFKANLGGGAFVPSLSITVALRDLYTMMDRGASFSPVVLLQVLRLAFPRFAEKGAGGVFMQQDANECWTELVRMLQQKLPAVPVEGASKQPKSLIEQYFGGRFDVEYKCDEAPEEAPARSEEDFLQLSCFISQDVRYMLSGLRSKLQEHITKNSPTLGRDAVYTKTSKISRLPAYLTVQFVRFYYKERESVNAKILKDVKFPMEFDAVELCTTELQEKLAPMRDRFKQLEDKKVEDQLNLKDKKAGDTKVKTTREPYWLENDLGSNNSGYYTLQAVLTHRGRSSSSGHYVGWVRQNDNTWLMCDDDKVTPVSGEDILKLSGGGDWHCAYVLLYGPRILEIPEGTTLAPPQAGRGEEKMETETSSNTQE